MKLLLIVLCLILACLVCAPPAFAACSAGLPGARLVKAKPVRKVASRVGERLKQILPRNR